MHEEWEIINLPSVEKLETTWRNLEEHDWSEMRVFGREKREQSRERSSEMRTGSYKEV